MLLPGLVLGFPPIHRGEWKRGVTASMSDEPTGISPDPKQPRPHLIRSTPPNLPSTSTRHHGLTVIIVISLCQRYEARAGLEQARKAAAVALQQVCAAIAIPSPHAVPPSIPQEHR